MMMGSSSNKLRFAAFLTAVFFLFTNTVYGYVIPAENTKEQGINLEVPEQFGKIDTLSLKENAPLILHIQSAHGNYEAEKNIQAILNHLTKKYGFDLLLLEGGVGKIDPNLYPKLNTIAADILMKKSELTGSETFLVEKMSDGKDRQVNAFGIEDARLYRENRKDFQEVMRSKEKSDTFLNQIERETEKFAANNLGVEIRNFLKQFEAYENKKIEALTFIQSLKKASSKKLGLNLDDNKNQTRWPTLTRLFRLESLKSQIDTSKIEDEKHGFSQAMKQLGMRFEIPEKNIRLSFERLMGDLPSNFSLEPYKNFCLSIQSRILEEELNPTGLFEEISKLKELILQASVRTDNEKQAIRKLENLKLLQKLFSLTLTRKEFDTLVSRDNEIKPSIQQINDLYQTAIRFYVGAHQREDAMFQNALSRMKSLGKKRTILITGGFHSDGIERNTETENFSYARISPRVNINQNNSDYILAMLEAHSNSIGQSQIEAILKLQSDSEFLEEGGNPEYRHEQIQEAIAMSLGNVNAARNNDQIFTDDNVSQIMKSAVLFNSIGTVSESAAFSLMEGKLRVTDMGNTIKIIDLKSDEIPKSNDQISVNTPLDTKGKEEPKSDLRPLYSLLKVGPNKKQESKVDLQQLQNFAKAIYSQNKDYYAMTNSQGNTEVHESKTHKTILTFRGTHDYSKLMTSPKGMYLAFHDIIGRPRIFNLSTGTEVKISFKYSTAGFSFSDDDNYVTFYYKSPGSDMDGLDYDKAIFDLKSARQVSQSDIDAKDEVKILLKSIGIPYGNLKFSPERKWAITESSRPQILHIALILKNPIYKKIVKDFGVKFPDVLSALSALIQKGKIHDKLTLISFLEHYAKNLRLSPDEIVASFDKPLELKIPEDEAELVIPEDVLEEPGITVKKAIAPALMPKGNGQSKRLPNAINTLKLMSLIGPNVKQIVSHSQSDLIAAIYADNTARVFDISAGEEIALPLNVLSPGIASVRFSPKGGWLIATEIKTGNVVIYNLKSRKQVPTPTGKIEEISFSDDEEFAAITLTVLANQKSEVIFRISAEKWEKIEVSNSIKDVKFSNGKTPLAAFRANISGTFRFKVFNLLTRTYVEIPGLNTASKVIFSPDGKWISVQAVGSPIKLYYAETLEEYGLKNISDIHFSPDGKFAFLKYYESSYTEERQPYYYEQGGYDLVRTKVENKTFRTKIVNMENARDLLVSLNTDFVEVKFSPKGNFILLKSRSGSSLYRVATGKEILKSGKDVLEHVDFSDDDSLIFARYKNSRRAFIFDANTGANLNIPILPGSNSCKFSADNRYAYINYFKSNGEFDQVFEIKTGQNIARFIGEDINTVIYSNNGTIMTVGYTTKGASPRVFYIQAILSNLAFRRALQEWGEDFFAGITILSDLVRDNLVLTDEQIIQYDKIFKAVRQNQAIDEFQYPGVLRKIFSTIQQGSLKPPFTETDATHIVESFSSAASLGAVPADQIYEKVITKNREVLQDNVFDPLAQDAIKHLDILLRAVKLKQQRGEPIQLNNFRVQTGQSELYAFIQRQNPATKQFEPNIPSSNGLKPVDGLPDKVDLNGAFDPKLGSVFKLTILAKTKPGQSSSRTAAAKPKTTETSAPSSQKSEKNGAANRERKSFYLRIAVILFVGIVAIPFVYKKFKRMAIGQSIDTPQRDEKRKTAFTKFNTFILQKKYAEAHLLLDQMNEDADFISFVHGNIKTGEERYVLEELSLYLTTVESAEKALSDGKKTDLYEYFETEEFLKLLDDGYAISKESQWLIKFLELKAAVINLKRNCENEIPGDARETLDRISRDLFDASRKNNIPDVRKSELEEIVKMVAELSERIPDLSNSTKEMVRRLSGASTAPTAPQYQTNPKIDNAFRQIVAFIWAKKYREANDLIERSKNDPDFASINCRLPDDDVTILVNPFRYLSALIHVLQSFDSGNTSAGNEAIRTLSKLYYNGRGYSPTIDNPIPNQLKYRYTFVSGIDKDLVDIFWLRAKTFMLKSTPQSEAELRTFVVNGSKLLAKISSLAIFPNSIRADVAATIQEFSELANRVPNLDSATNSNLEKIRSLNGNSLGAQTKTVLVLKTLASITVISGMAYVIYGTPLKAAATAQLGVDLANILIFGYFTVMNDFLGQWLSGRGIVKKQVAWALPLGLILGVVTWGGFKITNWAIPKDAAIPVLAADLLRVGGIWMMIRFRTMLYAKMVNLVRKNSKSKEEQDKQFESFWMTRSFSFVKNYFILKLIPEEFQTVAEGIANQYFQLFYSWSVNKEGFIFKSPGKHNSRLFLAFFPIAEPASLIFNRREPAPTPPAEEIKAASLGTQTEKEKLVFERVKELLLLNNNPDYEAATSALDAYTLPFTAEQIANIPVNSLAQYAFRQFLKQRGLIDKTNTPLDDYQQTLLTEELHNALKGKIALDEAIHETKETLAKLSSRSILSLDPNRPIIAVIGVGLAGSATVAGIKKKNPAAQIVLFDKGTGAGKILSAIPAFRPKVKEPYLIGKFGIAKLLNQDDVYLVTNFELGSKISFSDFSKLPFDEVIFAAGNPNPNIDRTIEGVAGSDVYTSDDIYQPYNVQELKLNGNQTADVEKLVRGKNIVIIGGGNVSLDVARISLEKGAKSSILVYRQDMETFVTKKTAKEERHGAEAAGVHYEMSAKVSKVIRNTESRIIQIELVRDGKKWTVPADLLVFAISDSLPNGLQLIGEKENPTIVDDPLNPSFRWIAVGDAAKRGGGKASDTLNSVRKEIKRVNTDGTKTVDDRRALIDKLSQIKASSLGYTAKTTIDFPGLEQNRDYLALKKYSDQQGRPLPRFIALTAHYFAGDFLYFPDAPDVLNSYLRILGITKEPVKPKASVNAFNNDFDLQTFLTFLKKQSVEDSLPLIVQDDVLKSGDTDQAAKLIAGALNDKDLLVATVEDQNIPPVISKLNRLSGNRFRVRTLNEKLVSAPRIAEMTRAYKIPPVAVSSYENGIDIQLAAGDKIRLDLRTLVAKGVDPIQVLALIRKISDEPALRQFLFNRAGFQFNETLGAWEVSNAFIARINSIYSAIQATQRSA